MSNNNELAIPKIERAHPLTTQEEKELFPDTAISRIRISHPMSQVCQNGTIPPGKYYADPDRLIGDTMIAQIIDKRMAAYQFDEDFNLVDASNNPKSDTFKRIKREALKIPSPTGFFCGPEALLWVFGLNQFGVFTFGKWYSRDIGLNILQPQSEEDQEITEKTGEYRGGLLHRTTMWSSRKEISKKNKQFHWYVPTIKFHSDPIDDIEPPDKDFMIQVITTFLNPPERAVVDAETEEENVR